MPCIEKKNTENVVFRDDKTLDSSSLPTFTSIFVENVTDVQFSDTLISLSAEFDRADHFPHPEIHSKPAFQNTILSWFLSHLSGSSFPVSFPGFSSSPWSLSLGCPRTWFSYHYTFLATSTVLLISYSSMTLHITYMPVTFPFISTDQTSLLNSRLEYETLLDIATGRHLK